MWAHSARVKYYNHSFTSFIWFFLLVSLVFAFIYSIFTHCRDYFIFFFHPLSSPFLPTCSPFIPPPSPSLSLLLSPSFSFSPRWSLYVILPSEAHHDTLEQFNGNVQQKQPQPKQQQQNNSRIFLAMSAIMVQYLVRNTWTFYLVWSALKKSGFPFEIRMIFTFSFEIARKIIVRNETKQSAHEYEHKSYIVFYRRCRKLQSHWIDIHALPQTITKLFQWIQLKLKSMTGNMIILILIILMFFTGFS